MKAVSILKLAGIEQPRLDAETLFAAALGMDRLKLFTARIDYIDQSTIDKFYYYIQERSRRKPISQILGFRYFFEHRYIVNEHVLTPRPETEEIVQAVLEEDLPDQSRILDLCCGTGCIGISILSERVDYHIDFADLSEHAIKCAMINLETILPDKLGNVRFFLSDLYSNVPEGKYQIIVSNPPYIHPDEKDHLMPELNFEPAIALYHEDPCDIARRIFLGGKERLIKGGFIIVETSPRYASIIHQEIEKHFSFSEVWKDISGLDRFVIARL